MYLLCVCGLIGCKTNYQTIGINYLSGDASTLTLRCEGIGKDKYESIANAEKNAIEALLFRGIPDSQQKDPLVLVTESDAKKNNKKYFDQLLGDKRYKTFIISSIQTIEPQNDKGRNKKNTVDVRINLRALRNDLEQEGVIRKFGF